MPAMVVTLGAMVFGTMVTLRVAAMPAVVAAVLAVVVTLGAMVF